MIRKIHCFTCGSHLSSNGTDVIVHPEMLSQIATSFDWKLYRPPITEGHPESANGTKACGWVRGFELSPDGRDLYALCSFNSYGRNLLKEELYKNISIGLKSPNEPTNPTPGKWSCDHLALVLKPAVKGLEEFSRSKDSCSETFTLPLKMLTKNPKVKPEEQDDAPVEMPSEKESAEQKFAEEEEEGEAEVEVSDVIPTEEEEETLSIEVEEDSEELANLKSEVEMLRMQLAEMAKERMRAEVASFADQMYDEGRLVEAYVPRADFCEFASKLANESAKGTFNFSEGVSMLEKFKALISALPSVISTDMQLPPKEGGEAGQVEFSESDLPIQSDRMMANANSMNLYKMATAYSRKNGCSFEEALKAVV